MWNARKKAKETPDPSSTSFGHFASKEGRRDPPVETLRIKEGRRRPKEGCEGHSFDAVEIPPNCRSTLPHPSTLPAMARGDVMSKDGDGDV